MKVVSNSSPLMALAVIDRLSLIRQKFGEIVVPDAVWQESVVAGQYKQGWKPFDRPIGFTSFPFGIGCWREP